MCIYQAMASFLCFVLLRGVVLCGPKNFFETLFIMLNTVQLRDIFRVSILVNGGTSATVFEGLSKEMNCG